MKSPKWREGLTLNKHRQICLFASFCAAVCLCSCTDSNRMCSQAEDCANICRTYDNNDIMYACVDGACKCVDESSLACEGEVTEKCETICTIYQPGTVAACVKKTCNCLPASDIEPQTCQSHADCASACADKQDGAAAVCIAQTCACIDRSCTGDPSRDKCDTICTLLEPDKTATCTAQKCECTDIVDKPESCTQADDCAAYCQQNGANQIYACTNNQCVCLDITSLVCTGKTEGECDSVCASIAPGKTGVCVKNQCECQ